MSDRTGEQMVRAVTKSIVDRLDDRFADDSSEPTYIYVSEWRQISAALRAAKAYAAVADGAAPGVGTDALLAEAAKRFDVLRAALAPLFSEDEP